MRAEYASDLTDRNLQVRVALAQAGCDALSLLGRLRMHHPNVLDGRVGFEELDHARDGARPRPDAVDSLDLSVFLDEKQRLDIEQRAYHRLRTAHPTAHFDVAPGGEQREDAAPGDPRR